MTDDQGAVLLVSILQLQVHAVLVGVLGEGGQQRLGTGALGSVACQIFEQERDGQGHQALDLLIRQTGLAGDGADGILGKHEFQKHSEQIHSVWYLPSENGNRILLLLYYTKGRKDFFY